MKALFNSALRQVRTFLIVAACALMIFSSMSPAIAAGRAPQSKPTDGETRLDKIMEKSEDAAQSGLDSMKDVAERSSRGLNEVQADADYNKMSRSSNSQEATTFTDQVKDAIKSATNK